MAEIAHAASEEDRITIITRLGQREGITVSRKVVREFIARDPDTELSDDALEMVVGGKQGGDGNDYLFMYIFDGDDTLNGMGGDDTLGGGGGDDIMDGGTGNDVLEGHDGNDRMDGGDGNDTMSGNDGNDSMGGNSGNDVVIGGAGNDWLYGDDGNDVLHGDSGDDNMDGGSGNDFFSGGSGDDSMDGGSGNDTLYGGKGDDLLIGGVGSDVYVFDNNTGNDTITTFQPDQDRLSLIGVSPDDITISHTEIVGFGGSNTATIITFGDNTITLEDTNLDREQLLDLIDFG